MYVIFHSNFVMYTGGVLNFDLGMEVRPEVLTTTL